MNFRPIKLFLLVLHKITVIKTHASIPVDLIYNALKVQAFSILHNHKRIVLCNCNYICSVLITCYLSINNQVPSLIDSKELYIVVKTF